MRIRTILLAACAAALIAPAASQAATLGMDGDTLVYRGEGAEGISVLLSYEDWQTGTEVPALRRLGRSITRTCWSRDVGVQGRSQRRDHLRPRPRPESRDPRRDGSNQRQQYNFAVQPRGRVPDSIPVEVYGGGGKDALGRLRARRPPHARRRRRQRPAQGLGRATTRSTAAPATTRSTAAAATTTSRAATATTRSPRHLPRARRRLRRRRRRHRHGRRLVDPERRDYHPPISVTLDGVANDGRPGETDNVVNVEKIESHVSGTLAGGDGRRRVHRLRNIDEGNSTLIGNGGNDKLTAGDYQDTLDGGAGQRRHQRRLRQRHAHRRPRPGHDQRRRHRRRCCNCYTCKIPFGNDVINARDGEADTIDCGVGKDRAVVDAIDVVANCETVERRGLQRRPPAGGQRRPGRPAAFHDRLGEAEGLGGLKVKVACASACTVKGSLKADKATARKLGTKKVASGKGKAGERRHARP